ncbi:MAG: DivIVA domain-containing protein [Clostridia bacterium]|nr:DivIVA domain-containing protein [Clostridia bacterium]
MITPQDIQTKEFAHGVRGYKEDEVDIFLDELTLDYEKLIKENESLKQSVAEMSQKLEEYKNQEGTVVKTLEAAKGLMSDISASAEKRAEILIKNAEIDAAAMIREAKDKLVALQNEEKLITSRINNYKTKFKALLESELKQFQEIVPKKEAAADPVAVEQFNDIVNSVPDASNKEFFESEEFKETNDKDETIVVSRKDD